MISQIMILKQENGLVPEENPVGRKDATMATRKNHELQRKWKKEIAMGITMGTNSEGAKDFLRIQNPGNKKPRSPAQEKIPNSISGTWPLTIRNEDE